MGYPLIIWKTDFITGFRAPRIQCAIFAKLCMQGMSDFYDKPHSTILISGAMWWDQSIERHPSTKTR